MIETLRSARQAGFRVIARIIGNLTTLAMGTLLLCLLSASCSTCRIEADKLSSQLYYIKYEDPTKLSAELALVKLENNHSDSWKQALGRPSEEILRKVSGHLSRHESAEASIVTRANVKRKVVALTFDDGPHALTTQELIDELKGLQVQATFFLVGSQVDKFPGVAKAIADAGFSIGNHTYDHVRLGIIPAHYIPTELLACNNVIKSATGTSPHLFRSPKGEHDDQVASIAQAVGLTTVLWDVNSRDLKYHSAPAIIERVLKYVRPGSIVLFHNGCPETLTALPEIVHTLRSQGYEFATVDQLLDEQARSARTSDETQRR